MRTSHANNTALREQTVFWHGTNMSTVVRQMFDRNTVEDEGLGQT